MVQMNGMGSTGSTELKLIDRMKEATREIHTKVEKRQFIQDLVGGVASKESYLQYLVDLKHIYEGLESALTQNKTDPKISAIVLPELFRSEKLDRDIKFFTGHEYVFTSEEAVNFVTAILDCPFSKLHLLPAYAYIRLLGDLFGGRDIGAAVIGKWGQEGAAFYDYTELMEKHNIESLPKFAFGTYRPAFNQLKMTHQEEEELVKEAYRAFELTDSLLLSYERK